MKEKIAAELNKVSQMTKEQKWEYFKSYYLAKSILLVIGLILFAWFIMDTFFQKEAVTAGCVYGVEISEEERQALTDGYLEYYKYNPKKYCAYISTDNMFEGTEQKMDASTHEMALFAQIAAGEIYYLILDKDTLDMMSNGGIYASLEDLFPNGLPDVYENCGVNLTDGETGMQYLAAIDLNKAGVFCDKGEAYLVFTIGIPDDKYPARFLEYLKTLENSN